MCCILKTKHLSTEASHTEALTLTGAPLRRRDGMNPYCQSAWQLAAQAKSTLTGNGKRVSFFVYFYHWHSLLLSLPNGSTAHIQTRETSQVVTGPNSTWRLPFTDASWSSAITVRAPLPDGETIRICWPECEGVEMGQREGGIENIMDRGEESTEQGV